MKTIVFQWYICIKHAKWSLFFWVTCILIKLICEFFYLQTAKNLTSGITAVDLSILLAFFMSLSVSNVLLSKSSIFFGRKQTDYITEQIFDRFFSSTIDKRSANSYRSRWSSILSTRLEVLAQSYVRSFVLLFENIIQLLIIGFVFLPFIDTWSFIVIIVVVLLYTLVSTIVSIRVEKASEIQEKQFFNTSQLVSFLIDAVELINFTRVKANAWQYCYSVNNKLRNAQNDITFFNGLARPLIELIIGTLTLVLIWNSTEQIFQQVIGIMIVSVFAVQRLMPLLQAANASLLSLKGNTGIMRDIFDLLTNERKHVHNISTFIAFIEAIVNELKRESKRNTVIFGSSGIGKSVSLMHAIMRHQDEFPSQNILFITQDFNLLDATVRENIEFLIYSLKLNLSHDKLKRYFEIIGPSDIYSYDDFLELTISNLSGGQKQRFIIMICMSAVGYDFICLDEPTSALDEVSAVNIIKYITDNFDNYIIISHNVDILKYFESRIELK